MQIIITSKTSYWGGPSYLVGKPTKSPYPEVDKSAWWVEEQTLAYSGKHSPGDIIEAVTKYENGQLTYIDADNQVGFQVPEAQVKEPTMEDVFNAAPAGQGHTWVAAVLWWKSQTENK